MDSYMNVFIKLAVGILALIIQINILGKGNLAPISAMDQVQNYALGGIIGGVIYNKSISALQFVMVLIIWTFLVLSLKVLKQYSYKIKTIIDGSPVVVIRKGEIEMDAVMSLGLSANELMFKLRSSGFDEIKEVKLAILEQNGQLTVDQYGESDTKYPIIQDGQINQMLLSVLDKTDDWVEEQVAKQYPGRKAADIYLGELINDEIVLYPFPDAKKGHAKVKKHH
ncbi:uncharacterized membrane protein YcaP (DUF421 family) [Weissella uvarum]|uniref:DUF421 domain-containing protein n=1 Tax=Weissella uvarum TaxID=1479233 RepID=UPI00195F7EB1|nr:DUF421 domain-containing protein [Weissella uvarum]MBM7617190.1 uncharacterized membrane protein YcaP (DUF421 family) [Weissella uvarum]MCM0595484.1 DUF421 domain-containing protein [Weissella uvarum]